jgi:hypothetical protein
MTGSCTARELGIQKTQVKSCVVDDDLCTAHDSPAAPGPLRQTWACRARNSLVMPWTRERLFVAVALGVHVEVQVVAGQLAVDQFDAGDFNHPVAAGRRTRPVVSVSRKIWRMAAALVVFLGVVDGVFGDFDHQVLLRQDGLAAQARVGLQAPGAVQQVFFGFIAVVQAVAVLRARSRGRWCRRSSCRRRARC